MLKGLCQRGGRLCEWDSCGNTVAVFGKGGEEVFAFDYDVCVLEDLEEGVAEPLSEFVEGDEAV